MLTFQLTQQHNTTSLDVHSHATETATISEDKENLTSTEKLIVDIMWPLHKGCVQACSQANLSPSIVTYVAPIVFNLRNSGGNWYLTKREASGGRSVSDSSSSGGLQISNSTACESMSRILKRVNSML